MPAATSLVTQAPWPLQVSAAEHAVTALLPQAVPEAWFPPSTQDATPAALQAIVPSLHAVGLVVQDPPGAQVVTHAPALLQAMFVPHDVPAGLGPGATQAPDWQTEAVVHTPAAVLQPLGSVVL